MRGLVMVLMTIDHASGAFNAGRFTADAAGRWTGGLELPAAQFLTRWVTHLCAPTFLFLAGAALALSTQRRLEAGESPRSVDGFHLRRGLFIVLLEPLWMSWALKEPGYVILQVLYVLGMGMMCMVPLRRLGARTLLGLGLLLPAANEAFIRWLGAETSPSVLEALLFNLGSFAGGRVIIGYPLLPWLGMMCLGWAFGRRLLESRTGVTRLLVGAGVAMLEGGPPWGVDALRVRRVKALYCPSSLLMRSSTGLGRPMKASSRRFSTPCGSQTVAGSSPIHSWGDASLSLPRLSKIQQRRSGPTSMLNRTTGCVRRSSSFLHPMSSHDSG
ncbi:uncharacterized protein DUF1624 [Archangium gephyra]|nr:uncharacterized protein DUF1624 [Archangium gephyra]